MHKLIDYICDEMEELERKADKGKLSMAEVQYADMLAHLKKNILTSDAMMEADDEYSNDGGMSYARGRSGRYTTGRRMYDSGYSRDKDDMVSQLKNMERNADDEESRRMIKSWMKQLGDR